MTNREKEEGMKGKTKRERMAIKAKERSRQNTEARKRKNAQARRRERRKFVVAQRSNTVAKKQVVASATEKFDLNDLTVSDLRSRAKEQGVKGFSKMKKSDLVAALNGSK